MKDIKSHSCKRAVNYAMCKKVIQCGVMINIKKEPRRALGGLGKRNNDILRCPMEEGDAVLHAVLKGQEDFKRIVDHEHLS